MIIKEKHRSCYHLKENLKKTTSEMRAPKQTEITIQTDGAPPNRKVIAGDSVNEHKYQEVANAIIAGDEIKQQNENL